MILLELFLKIFFSSFVYPMALEISRRRELDPVFKAEADRVYAEWKGAETTEARKAAARKLYDLQKNS
jgi:hypothetical protein